MAGNELRAQGGGALLPRGRIAVATMGDGAEREGRRRCDFCSQSCGTHRNNNTSRRGDTFPEVNWSDPQKPQTHRQPDKHPSRLCPHSSSSAASLAIHERTHIGERPFSCGVCEKTFAKRYGLMAHDRTHTGEKPFKCNTCSKAFTLKRTLANHERIHTGEKPFKCNTCSKAFTRKTNLANHERTHTGEKPYRCETCNRAFAAHSNLNSHRKIYHR
ncbi:zinc finger protein 2-like isoform X2 [Ixodes scapularis]|uniref:zinc finger protein 2-like isoform X2 n=1 Tax=Ixodes scapularis TaxID=6945 RepID=UPI001C3923C0|nr:zinc finger protein 2-like isoform X2 [Ixodes scapularis]